MIELMLVAFLELQSGEDAPLFIHSSQWTTIAEPIRIPPGPVTIKVIECDQPADTDWFDQHCKWQTTERARIIEDVPEPYMQMYDDPTGIEWRENQKPCVDLMRDLKETEWQPLHDSDGKKAKRGKCQKFRDHCEWASPIVSVISSVVVPVFLAVIKNH